MPETYWELICLDCGNDEQFSVEVSVRCGQMLDGEGELLGEEVGDWYITRHHWDTLECSDCQSTNVQRRRRTRKEAG